MATMMKEESFTGTGGKIAFRSWIPEGAHTVITRLDRVIHAIA